MAGRRGSVRRKKPKKKSNRYNPNSPEWRMVHDKIYQLIFGKK
jgi:hypothetical protein